MPKISLFVARLIWLLACVFASSGVCAQAPKTVCRFSSATGVAFGVYDDGSPVTRDTTANVAIDCSRNGGPQNVTVTVSLAPSATSGSISTRRMRQGSGDTLTYNLYRDSARAQVWGQTTGVDTMTQMLSIPNNSSMSATFTIFGRIGALQNVSAGSYADSVVATVSY